MFANGIVIWFTFRSKRFIRVFSYLNCYSAMSLFSGRCESTVKLVGKTAVVTGCNTGIGKETVKDFYKRGARVLMLCRNIQKAAEAKKDIEEKLCGEIQLKGKLVILKCDLASLKSIRECAQKILDTEPQVNILVNNAGVMMCPEGRTEDGFETQFGTNHLGHFLLTLLLLPRIRNSKPARIVTVSSMAHTFYNSDLDDPNFEKKPYGASNAYSQSKLANVLFSRELASKLKEHNIEDVNTYSLHPGIVETELGRHVTSLSVKMVTWILWPFLKTAESGVQTTLYCAIDEKCAHETGLYYSDCAVARPSKLALDNENAKKLWELSEKLVNLGSFNPFTATDPGVKK